MTVSVDALTGAQIADALEDLARLRITVFRDWPYLYDGDVAYEERYLRGYADHSDALLVAAREGDRIVGASTGMPLISHGDAARLELPADAPDRASIYYCAESVLLPDYRGQGIGNAFFDLRERKARDSGFRLALFAAVLRDERDPRRPPDYRSLEPFWRKRGYAPLPEARLAISWKDIGARGETEKPLQVWTKEL